MTRIKAIKEKPAQTKGSKKKLRLLTEKEMVFGFGSKPRAEQLDEFFSRPDGKGIPLDKAFSQIRANIKKRRGGWSVN